MSFIPFFISLFIPLSCAYSQTIQTNNEDAEPIVIIGSRFRDTLDAVPAGVIVITAADIRDAGMDNVNEAIRKLAGVYGRQNFSGTQDFYLDMDGFGADSTSNLVLLIDGVRLSESEQAASLLSSIPIDSVARIEIMRGGGSVLYGDGAIGGVIQIITKQTGQTPLTGSVATELGQFNDRSARISLLQGWDKWNASLNLSDQQSDNYRINNAVSQKNASGALIWYGDAWRAGLRVDVARQESGFPGALATLAQFEQDPRQAQNLDDHGSSSLDRYTAFMEKNVGTWQVAAELSTRERAVESHFVSQQSTSIYHGAQTGFTPRLRYVTAIDGLHHELVAGLDLMNWSRQTESNYSHTYATQKSTAIYFRHEMNTDKVRFSFGARREVADKTSTNPFSYLVDNYHVVQGVNAWELQGSYAFSPAMHVFAKAGQSYRLANVDDNALVTVLNTPLLPQRSHDVEFGTVLGKPNQQLTLRLFRHQITDEIYYNPLVGGGMGANVNLDPTRHQGMAVDAKFRLSPQFRLTAQAQHVEARLTSGVNDGKELVLVPKNSVSARINWVSDDGKKAYLGVQWTDTQRYGGDFANTCEALIPAHATLDARYSQTFGAWEWAIFGSNLTDKKYFTNAYGCMSGIYPDAARQMKVSLRYRF